MKSHALTNLDQYLEQAETQLLANGAKVHWAETAHDALGLLEEIVRDHGISTAVKAKSMLSEELGINEHLEHLGVHVRETDLGEYIIQLIGEPPSHIVGPAIHRSLEDCQRLFTKNSAPHSMTDLTHSQQQPVKHSEKSSWLLIWGYQAATFSLLKLAQLPSSRMKGISDSQHPCPVFILP